MTVDIEKVYITYGPMVLRRCRRILKDEDLALDAMQDTFLNLVESENKIKDTALSSFLYTIATNVSLNKIRTLKRAAETYEEELLFKIAAVDETEKETAFSMFLDSLFQRHKESSRTIAVLHFVDGMTLEEVAKEVNLSVSGVRKRLRLLKEEIKNIGKEVIL